MRYPLLLPLALIASASSLQGQGRTNLVITLKDGSQRTIPLADIVRMEYSGSCSSAAAGGTVKLFSNLSQRPSSAFKANLVSTLSIQTSANDPTPYYMTTPYRGVLSLGPGQKAFLAGNATGTSEWSVDNFLYFELTSSRGTTRFYVGESEPISFGGRPLPRVGRNGFQFSPGEIDLTQFFPAGETVQVLAYAMDYGGVGYLSDVYLVVK